MKSMPGKISLACLAAVICLIFLTSCTGTTEPVVPQPSPIADQTGKTLTFKVPPQRIVSLAPSNTEILYALGLADSIVAVTDYCNYPPETKLKPSIGGFSTPNIEEVLAKNPDLVLAANIHENKIVPQLEARGLTVLTLNPKTIDEVLETIMLVGKVTGKEKEAQALAANMQQRIKAVTYKTGLLSYRPSTSFIVWHNPLMVAGEGTLQDEIIGKAGGINIAGSLSLKTGYPDISLESFIAANPAVIIVGVGMGEGQDKPLLFIRSESRLKDTDAIKNNRVFAIDQDIAGRAGPRIVDALEQFAGFICPERFK
jgi:iron complex transport system substrate-binding protein